MFKKVFSGALGLLLATSNALHLQTELGSEDNEMDADALI